MRNTYYTYLLLGSTILSGTMLNLSVAQAACTPAPDCKTLGYTATSCPDAGAKCPWNTSLMFCICGSDYIHTCTGSNETGGSGDSCGGKYTACTCASGYTWDGSGCIQFCPLGSILNSDMSCTSDTVSGKTPIGVVSYVNGSTRLAINLTSISGVWGSNDTDISGITNYTDSTAVLNDFNGKSNSAYAAATNNATYCYNYTTTGTSVHDWYLPAEGELYASVWTNKSSVNAGLSKAGGTAIVEGGHWSSSEYDGNSVWVVGTGGGSVTYADKINGNAYVRCVVEFEDNGDRTAKVCGADYLYTCTGEGYSGGVGDSCGGKYASCTCASGYDWNGSSCHSCAVGDILNSDMSCTSDKVSGKTPIGVVSYINGSKRIAIQLDAPGYMYWSDGYTDISGITNYISSSEALNDFSGKSNTQAWANYYVTYDAASASNYAPGYCYNYTTTGTSKGDWYLPAAGELYASVYTNYSTVNAGLSKAGGTAILEGYHWSSSEYADTIAWYVYGRSGTVGSLGKDDYSCFVRCVLAF